MRYLLYGVFVLSGAAGLIYESVWPRYLKLFVGHGAYAQVLVLAVFLGGMSVGSFLAGRRAERMSRPLLVYAGVETAVGLAGLFFHPVYAALTGWAYDTLFPRVSAAAAVALAKWSIAVFLILPQSVLLGATFPLMAAAVIRRRGPGTAGSSVSVLYFTNSLGAAAGVLVSGFALLPGLGLPATSMTAGLLNLAVALVAYAVEKAAPAAAPEPAAKPVSGAGASDRGLWPTLLLVAFGTAVASFLYEISWIRMLSLVLGASTHAFELMLSAFILGLALGGLAIRGRLDSLAEPVPDLARIQLLMGFAALLTVPGYLVSFQTMAWLMKAFARTGPGYVGFNAARYALCAALMVPPTFLAGMTLPLITKLGLSLTRSERAIGYVYGANTLGSIAGVLAAGLALMPVLGLKNLMVLASAIDMGLGVLLLAVLARHVPRYRAWAAGCGAATALACLAVAAGVRLDPLVLGGGVFRTGSAAVSATKTSLFHRDGRTATITVERDRSPGGDLVTLKTNGKPDASVGYDWLRSVRDGTPLARRVMDSDESTMLLAGLLGLAHRPGARTVGVIGLGSGITSHTLLGARAVERVETVEIEPAVVEAAKEFLPLNRRVYEDPRSVLVIDDAKSHFAASRRKYDLVVSEPSNPWVSGVSNLFTYEFYRRMRADLAPGGVFAQWIQLYEIDDALVLSILRALDDAFSAYRMYQVGPLDVLIVATGAPALPAPDWSVAREPGLAADLRPFAPLVPAHLDALLLFTREELHPLAGHFPDRNSDYRPYVDAGAERARYFRSAGGFLDYYGAAPFDPLAALTGAARPAAPASGGPFPFLGRYRLAGLGAAVRARLSGTAVTLPGADLVQARVGNFARLLRSGEPAESWSPWLDELAWLHAALHAGSAGAVDEGFYRRVFDYLAKARAPARVVDAVTALHEGARWNFTAAAGACGRLRAGGALQKPWLGEVAAASWLAAKQPARARDALSAVAPASPLRGALLWAWAEGGG